MSYPIEVTEVNIHPVKSQEEGNPLAAYVRIVLNDAFVVTNIRIIKGKFGLFISFPREYNQKEGKGYNLCYPTTKALQEAISTRVLADWKALQDQEVVRG